MEQNGAERRADFAANIRPVVKLYFYHENRFFGPGVYTLLSLVEKTGSLRAACAEMNMSYSKGLKIVKNAEMQLTCALVMKSRGGREHGSTTLTDDGRRLLTLYDAMSREMQRLSAGVFDGCAAQIPG